MGKFSKNIMRQQIKKEEPSSVEQGVKIDVGAGLLSTASVSAISSPIKEMETIYVLPEQMIPSEDNEISMNPTEIETLAESFREVGMLQAPIIKKISDDKYRIVCGEKRYRATLWNIERGYRKSDEPIKCSLFNPELIDLKGFSDDEKEDYVRDEENVLQRNKTDADKLMLLRKYEARYNLMRERDPEKFKGIKTRTLLVQGLQMSASQIAQFKKIENQGSEELIKAVENEKVNISTAVDIASMERKEQAELIEKALRTKKEDEKIGQKDVLMFKHDKKASDTTKTSASKTDTENISEQTTDEPDNQNVHIDEKVLKQDLKDIFKKLKASGGVELDELQYTSYLRAIASLEKIF